MFLEYKNPFTGICEWASEGSKASESVEFGVCEYAYFPQDRW